MKINKFFLSMLVLLFCVQTKMAWGMEGKNNDDDISIIENNNDSMTTMLKDDKYSHVSTVSNPVKEHWFSRDIDFKFFKNSVHNIAFFPSGDALEIYPAVNPNRYNQNWKCINDNNGVTEQKVFYNKLGKFSLFDKNDKKISFVSKKAVLLKENFLITLSDFKSSDNKQKIHHTQNNEYVSIQKIVSPKEQLSVLEGQDKIKFIRLAKSFWSNFKN